MGDLSAHFNRSEFRCKGHGQPGHRDHDTPVDLELVGRLEMLRELKGGRPLIIVSGHRCAYWNRLIGGARNSQHLAPVRGRPGTRGADIFKWYATVEEAASVGFKGIGDSNGWAIHVDTRARPARWHY